MAFRFVAEDLDITPLSNDEDSCRLADEFGWAKWFVASIDTCEDWGTLGYITRITVKATLQG